MYWWEAIYDNDARVIPRICHFREDRDARGLTGLHVACEAGHPRLVTAFLRAGLDVNDSFPMSPLLYAARSGNCASVRILLRAAARIPVSWSVMRMPARVRTPLLAHRATYKWRAWARQRRRTRERQWARIVWLAKHLSCDKNELIYYL